MITAWGDGRPEAAVYAEALKHFQGDGVPQDAAKAVDLLTQAADTGHTAAMVELARCYENGIGCLKDGARAVELYQQAAEAGNAAGMRELGLRYEWGSWLPADLAKANEWYEKAGQAGDARGWQYLANNHREGRGVAKNPAKAVELYQKAAGLGHPRAFHDLAHSYQDGAGVRQDSTKALDHFKKAAELGDDTVWKCFGEIYEKGRGVRKNSQEALRLYRKGWLLGDEECEKAFQRLSKSSGLSLASLPAAPEKASRLLNEARRELDLEQYDPCAEHCRQALALLKKDDPDHWLAWTLAQATLAGALLGNGQTGQALYAVGEGLLEGTGREEMLRKAYPDRCARLLEIRGSIMVRKLQEAASPARDARRTAVAEDSEATGKLRSFEITVLATSAAQNWESAQALATSPVFKVSVYAAAAAGWLEMALSTKETTNASKALEHADEGLKLAGSAAPARLMRARLQTSAAGALTLLAAQGRPDNQDWKERATSHLNAALKVFQEQVPDTRAASTAAALLSLLENWTGGLEATARAQAILAPSSNAPPTVPIPGPSPAPASIPLKGVL